MKNKIKKIFISLWENAYNQNKKNIIDLVDEDSRAFFVDLGCDDGVWTKRVTRKINTKSIFGLDYIDTQLKKANALGINTKKGNLNEKFPYKNDFFDVVHSNQVIEHLTEIDNYISEIFRVLKPGGYTIISTENLSSWHNIFSLVIGWQAFSQHISKRYHIGNPLSPHFEEDLKEGWTHNIIFTFYSLKEIFIIYGFEIEDARGAGYYPLPEFFARVDPRHSHFITIKARKPKNN